MAGGGAISQNNAQIDRYGYAKECNVMDLTVYNEKINELSIELETIRQTLAVDVSLFKTLEERLGICKRRES